MKIGYSIKSGDYIESAKGEVVRFYYKYDIEAIKKAFEFGLEEAWEAVKKIMSSTDKGGLPIPATKEMFSYLYPEDIFEKYSAKEVIKKIKEYEEKKNKEENVKNVSSEMLEKINISAGEGIKKFQKDKQKEQTDGKDSVVGKKFVIEIESEEECCFFEGNGTSGRLYETVCKIKGTDAYITKTDLDKLEEYKKKPTIPREEIEKEGYEKGLNEAWEAARELFTEEKNGCVSNKSIIKAFNGLCLNDIFRLHTAKEAVKAIKDYEEKKAEKDERIEYLKHEDIKKDGKTVRVWYGGNDSRCAIREKKENVQFPGKISEKVYDRYSELMKEAISKTFERMNENKSEEEKKAQEEEKMKTGDKFIIEIGNKLEKIAFPNGQYQLTGEYYNIKGTFAMISEREYENLKKYDEEGIEKEGYEKGLNELWETLKQVQNMILKDYEECTGLKFKYNLYSKITPMELVEKFKEWKEKKEDEKIKVGDEIESSEQIEKAVVLWIEADGHWGCLQNNLCIFTVNDKQKKYWKKTGKHYDEVDKIFQKLKESEGEIPFL